MNARVEISGRPTGTQALRVWSEIFPVEGPYAIEFLGKAGGEAGEPFETWFLQRLLDVSEEHFVMSQQSIWQVLDELLLRRGIEAPSELDYWELNRVLFDLTHASTARMVGINVPREVSERLLAMGWRAPEVMDFPALAYRMGLIYARLKQAQPPQWNEVVSMARAVPLGSAERAAIEHVRRRAGVFLRPIYDETGRVWTAEREIVPLRRLTEEALQHRIGTEEAARELGKQQRAQGIFRDAHRVMRTEIAEARGRGVWKTESKGLAPDELVFRQTSRTPCKGCLRLYRNPDGTPRLYTRRELEASDALGLNRGGPDKWHAVVGSTHPHCVCAPWSRYYESMRPLFEQTAAPYRAVIEALGVFREAA
jgi:hypothetical protein